MQFLSLVVQIAKFLFKSKCTIAVSISILCIFEIGLLDIRFGQEDNSNNEKHPCPGLFETCCLLRSEKPIIPAETKVNVGCGIRNTDGVGFRITGDKDGEAQFGMCIFFFFCFQYKRIFIIALNLIHTGEFPWTVAILKEEKALDGQILNVYVCGGSIIDAGDYKLILI